MLQSDCLWVRTFESSWKTELWLITLSCSDGSLIQLAHDENPFYLIGYNPSQLASPLIQACDQYFWVQNGGPCTYCPTLPDGATCPPGTSTVIYASGVMVSLMVTLLAYTSN